MSIMAFFRCSLILPVVATAGCAFSGLEKDLDKLDELSLLFTGTLSSERLELHTTVIVALKDLLRESAH